TAMNHSCQSQRPKRLRDEDFESQDSPTGSKRQAQQLPCQKRTVTPNSFNLSKTCPLSQTPLQSLNLDFTSYENQFLSSAASPHFFFGPVPVIEESHPAVVELDAVLDELDMLGDEALRPREILTDLIGRGGENSKKWFCNATIVLSVIWVAGVEAGDGIKLSKVIKEVEKRIRKNYSNKIGENTEDIEPFGIKSYQDIIAGDIQNNSSFLFNNESTIPTLWPKYEGAFQTSENGFFETNLADLSKLCDAVLHRNGSQLDPRMLLPWRKASVNGTAKRLFRTPKALIRNSISSKNLQQSLMKSSLMAKAMLNTTPLLMRIEKTKNNLSVEKSDTLIAAQNVLNKILAVSPKDSTFILSIGDNAKISEVNTKIGIKLEKFL
ncbi:hypothetical protein HK096_004525, partial [Nowakowskiella sp. JEL0078]